MRYYLIRRLLLMIPLVLMISFVAFALMSLSPSNPAEVALRVNEIVPTDEAIAAMQHELGLDKPFLSQYFSWLGRSLQLDLGTSFITRKPVLHEFLLALPATLKLASYSLGIIMLLSLSLGMMSALLAGTRLDKGVRAILFVLTAVPSYWVGLLLIWLFSLYWDLLPVGGMMETTSVILPALTLSLAYVGTYMRLIRSSVLTNLQQNYVRYARMRGLSERRIIGKHVLVNSLHSTLIALGMSIPKLIAGTIVVENIFAWPGIGRLCVSAIFNRDYPLIQAYILLMALLFVTFNFVVDIIQVWSDPRIGFGAHR